MKIFSSPVPNLYCMRLGKFRAYFSKHEGFSFFYGIDSRYHYHGFTKCFGDKC